MARSIGEMVNFTSLLLPGVLVMVLLSASAFCDDTLNAGDSKAGGASGIITIGGMAPDFTGSSGAIVLSGSAAIVSDGSGGNDIKLGDYWRADGAAIFTGGNAITGIALAATDLDAATGVTGAGYLTIYGGTDAATNGAVTIIGAISTATAALTILGVSGKDVGITATAGSIGMGVNQIDTRNGANDGGSVLLKITDSRSSGDITVGDIISSSFSYASSGNGGAVTVSTTGGDINVGSIQSSSSSSGNGGAVTVSTTSGAITVGDILSYSTHGTGGAVKVLAANGMLSGLGNIITNGTVTVNTGELACNIGNTGTSSHKAEQVDITIGNVTGSNRAIGSITTTNADVNITSGSNTGFGLTLGSIDAGNGSINLNAASGTLTLNGATATSTLNITVGKGAKFVTGSTVDLSGNKGTLTLDLGDDTDLSVYAKTIGTFKSSGTTEVTSI